MKPHIIIGLSAAGVSVLHHLRNLSPEATIIGITDQNEMPYNKCILVDYCMGLKTREQLNILNPAVAQASNVQLLFGVRVIQINPQESSITLSDGRQLSYASLFIGTGTAVVSVPIKGIYNGNGVFTFHTLADIDALLAYSANKKPQTAVIIGAGLSGLECADALSSKGIRVALVDQSSHVLHKSISLQAAHVIERAAVSHNARFYAKTKVQEIQYEQGVVQEVVLASGQRLPADVVVIAAGARPRSQLAAEAGIALHEGGIITNEYMQTTIANIYAGGDVACVMDQVTGQRVQSCLWPDAMHQGLIAAHAIAGKPKRYPGAFLLTSSAFFGLKFASCGPIVNPPEGAEVLEVTTPGGYQAFVLHHDLLLGFALVGDITVASRLKRAMLTREKVSKDAILRGF